MGAPAFGAAMFSEAMALAAFEDGGLVADNQLALLHKREMVLPAEISEGLQRMIGKGSSDGGSHSNQHVHIHVHAHDSLDTEGIDRVLTKHQAAFQKHFTSWARKRASKS